MRRRDFITLVGSTVLARPLTAFAAGPVRLIGVLMAYAKNDLNAQSQLAVFRGALKKLGWIEGDNLKIEIRWGGGSVEKIATSANELVELRPDAILGVTTPAIGALARKTKTIPLVFNLVADPIGNGFAASLTHPGGNITGFAAYDPAVAGKWVELLKQVAPPTKRVALLFNPTTASPLQLYMPSIQAAASSLAVETSAAPVHTRNEIESVIAAQSADGASSSCPTHLTSQIAIQSLHSRRNMLCRQSITPPFMRIRVAWSPMARLWSNLSAGRLDTSTASSKAPNRVSYRSNCLLNTS